MRKGNESMQESAAIYSSQEKAREKANSVPSGRQIIKSLLDSQVGISMNQNGGAYR